MKHFLIALMLMALPSFAMAKPHYHSEQGAKVHHGVSAKRKLNKNYHKKKYYRTASHTERRKARRIARHTTRHNAHVHVTGGRHNAGPRPGRWCGWYMRTRHGGGAEYNLARNWAKRGVSAGGPRVGAIVVWKHHVGEIVGRASNGQWLVHSGNTGVGRGKARGVSTKPRSVAGAIAFRML